MLLQREVDRRLEEIRLEKMLVNVGGGDYLNTEGQEYLRRAVKNPKYAVIVELLMGHGLRVSEALSLTWGSFDFTNKVLTVVTLKQRGEKEEKRYLPMTDKLISKLGVWWKKTKYKKDKDFVCSGIDSYSAISRQAIDKKLRNIIPGLSAHNLRHTFGMMKTAEGTDLLVTSKLLGHKSIKTTQIYAHVPMEILRDTMRPEVRLTMFEKMYLKVFPKDEVVAIPVRFGELKIHVGRKFEINKLRELAGKKINTLLEGPYNSGKSHILNNFDMPNVFRFDQVGSVKKMLGQMILKLADDAYMEKQGIDKEVDDDGNEIMIHGFVGKSHVIEMLTKNANLKRFVMAENILNLTQVLIDAVDKNEYTIIIDDVTDITKSGVKLLEKLKGHFHIVCGARKVKIVNGTFLSNFEKIEVGNLNRAESNELTKLLTEDFRSNIADFSSLENHVFDQTNGLPGAIIEMCERYRAEGKMSVSEIKDICHTSAVKQLDMFLPVLLILSSLMVLRYFGNEIGVDRGAFKLAGGIFMVVALFGRQLMQAGKRKFV